MTSTTTLLKAEDSMRSPTPKNRDYLKPLVDELFPDVGAIRFKDGQGPFRFLASQDRSNQSAKKKQIRETLRTGLDILVKFAFLLNERTSLIADQCDKFLVQLERVCRLLEQSQTDCKGKRRTRGTQKRVNVDSDEEASEESQPSSPITSLQETRVPSMGFRSNAGPNFGRIAVEADGRTAYQQGLREGTMGTTVPPPQAANGIARKVISNGHKRANPIMEEMSNENGRESSKRSRGVEFQSPHSKRARTQDNQEFERAVEESGRALEVMRQAKNRLEKLEAKNEELEVRLAESQAESQAAKKEIDELKIKYKPLEDLAKGMTSWVQDQ
ncbi:hypothetical protein EJ07DRAFT_152955 [Lizonia empirigonia]|nr:hypothetical protein EJ07DRAFT_152955 [Lizonia empirigonia]